MSSPHAIRLRGPWEMQALDNPPDNPAAVHKVDVPGDWGEILGNDLRGAVRYTRRFNAPTNLSSSERVWLVFDGVDHQAEIARNGKVAGSVAGYQHSQRIDITELLRAHNILSVDVSLPETVFADPTSRPGRAGLAGGLIGEVRLEIE